MLDQRPSPPRPSSPPWATLALLMANFLVWIAMVFGGGVDPLTPSAQELLDWGGNLGVLTLHGQWWRLLTSMFLHAGLVHLLFNGYFAWVVGRATEQVFGSAAFLLIYLGSGLLASAVSMLWQPAVVSVGASGALFGVFGAFLGFTLHRRDVLPRVFVVQVYRNALLLIVINVVIGLTVPNIDLAAHLGGLIGGFGLGWLLTNRARALRPSCQSR